MKRLLTAVLAVMAWGGVVEAQDAGKPGTTTPAPKTEASTPTEAGATYKIGPQDVLRIDVWKEPELSRTIPVRPDGKISLPLLNDVQSAEA